MRETTVARYTQRNRHGFHILMSILTCGLWTFTGWPLMVAWSHLRSGRKSWTTVTTRESETCEEAQP